MYSPEVFGRSQSNVLIVEVFTNLLWEGSHEYSYAARATTLGKFIVPPCSAEEMYSPEVFGRSQSNVLIVE